MFHPLKLGAFLALSTLLLNPLSPSFQIAALHAGWVA